MSAYRDSLPDDATRDRYDECITAAAKTYARARLDMAASGEPAGEKAA